MNLILADQVSEVMLFWEKPRRIVEYKFWKAAW